MSKCGKDCMPECEYFTTGGCISPFNCLYKIETGYINSSTSIPAYMGQCNGMSNDDTKHLKAEIADLHKKLKETEHRAEIAEERLKNLKKTEGNLTVEDEMNILDFLVQTSTQRASWLEQKFVQYRNQYRKYKKKFRSCKKRAEAAEMKLGRISDVIRYATWDAYYLGSTGKRFKCLSETSDAMESIINKALEKVTYSIEGKNE